MYKLLTKKNSHKHCIRREERGPWAWGCRVDHCQGRGDLETQMIDRKKLAARTCALLRRKNNYRDRDCMLKGNYAGIQEKRELLESNGDNLNEVLVHLLVPIND